MAVGFSWIATDHAKIRQFPSSAAATAAAATTDENWVVLYTLAACSSLLYTKAENIYNLHKIVLSYVSLLECHNSKMPLFCSEWTCSDSDRLDYFKGTEFKSHWLSSRLSYEVHKLEVLGFKKLGYSLGTLHQL